MGGSPWQEVSLVGGLPSGGCLPGGGLPGRGWGSPW